MLQQMALFHSFLWLSSIPLYICIFLLFSNSLLNFSLCSSTLLPSLLGIFMIITLNSFWVDFLSPLPIVLLLRFYLVLSFGAYSSVASFCLIPWVYYCIFGGLVIFPDLGEVALFRRLLMGLSSILQSGHQSRIL